MRLTIITALFLIASCKKESKEILVPYPNDITFEDQQLDRFSFNIPSAPYSAGDEASGIITMNVKKEGASFSGFAVSNKNWCSYPWSLSPDFAPSTPLTAAQRQAAIDSTIFSVFTSFTTTTVKPNRTANFLVGNAKNNEAFITLSKPAVIEHILVANNTYSYLLAAYGSIYAGGTRNAATQQFSLTGTKVRNILNPNTSSAAFGRFYLPGPEGVDVAYLQGAEVLAKIQAGREAAQAARQAEKTPPQVTADSLAAYTALSKGFVKLTIQGFVGSKETGSVDYWLAIRPKVDPANPLLNIIRSDWNKVDLTSLGTVDKILFNITSSYTDTNGKSLLPSYFCLDGMRIRK